MGTPLCKQGNPLLDFRALTGRRPTKRQRETAGAAGPTSQCQTERCAMQDYDKLKQLVEQAAEDVQKAEGGNKAAGTRVRKIMQDIKSAAQEVRKKILEVRSSDEA